MGNGVNKVLVDPGTSEPQVFVEVRTPVTGIVTPRHVTFAVPVHSIKPIEEVLNPTSSSEGTDISGTEISPQPHKSNLRSTINHTRQDKNTNWSQYEIEALNAHNCIRYRHGLNALALNKELCQMAEVYATTLIEKKTFCHSDPVGRLYRGEASGENIAAFGMIGALIRYPGHTAVYQWYEEMKYFNFSKPRCSERSRHFCQLVWPSTKEFGQACVKRKEGKWTHYIAVAYYFPTGNMKGKIDLVPPIMNKHTTDLV